MTKVRIKPAEALIALALLAAACTTSVNPSVGGPSSSGGPTLSTPQQSLEGVKLTWTAHVSGAPTHTSVPANYIVPGFSVAPFAPTIADGLTFIGTESGKLFAFSESCGSSGTRCEPLWIGQTHSAILSPPAVTDGTVFVRTESEQLFAFSESCGDAGASCQPRWVADVGEAPDIGGTVGSPAVADGVVYAVDGEDGILRAFEATCSTGSDRTCDPVWSAQAPGEMSSATVADGVVYAAAGSRKGTPALYAFDAGNGRVLWVGTTQERGIYGTTGPVVDGDRIFVTFGANRLYAFARACPTDGQTCTPEWTGLVPSGYREGGPVVSDYGVGVPVVSGGAVYVEYWNLNQGFLRAFSVGCGQDGVTCRPMWSASTGGCCTGTAADGERLFVSSNRGGLVEAFADGCDGLSCTPVWRFLSQDGPTAQLNDAYHPWLSTRPIAVDGLVFGTKHFEGLRGDELYALSADCGSGGTACQPVWDWTGPAGTGGASSGDLSSPAVADGMLFAASTDGTVYAFTLPREER